MATLGLCLFFKRNTGKTHSRTNGKTGGLGESDSAGRRNPSRGSNDEGISELGPWDSKGNVDRLDE